MRHLATGVGICAGDCMSRLSNETINHLQSTLLPYYWYSI